MSINHIDYQLYEYYDGFGIDIGWCNRNTGGKYCQLCGKHSKFEEWSKEWYWFYLLNWHYNFDLRLKHHLVKYPFCHISAKNHFYQSHRRTGKSRWYNYRGAGENKQPHPKRYSSRGLDIKQFESLLRKGCKPKKKCKCVSLIQRGSWYCPMCYKAIYKMSEYKGITPHDVMIMDRRELKSELLILRLSGVLKEV